MVKIIIKCIAWYNCFNWINTLSGFYFILIWSAWYTLYWRIIMLLFFNESSKNISFVLLKKKKLPRFIHRNILKFKEGEVNKMMKVKVLFDQKQLVIWWSLKLVLLLLYEAKLLNICSVVYYQLSFNNINNFIRCSIFNWWKRLKYVSHTMSSKIGKQNPRTSRQ